VPIFTVNAYTERLQDSVTYLTQLESTRKIIGNILEGTEKVIKESQVNANGIRETLVKATKSFMDVKASRDAAVDAVKAAKKLRASSVVKSHLTIWCWSDG
jgi:hypothetical protein